jgi:hypothetical protein
LQPKRAGRRQLLESNEAGSSRLQRIGVDSPESLMLRSECRNCENCEEIDEPLPTARLQGPAVKSTASEGHRTRKRQAQVMDDRRRPAPFRHRLARGIAWGVGACVLAFAPAFSSDFSEDFAGGKPSWRVESLGSGVRTTAHFRTRGTSPSGKYEYFRFTAATRGATVRILHPLPAAVAIEDVKLSLDWIANVRGATVYLQVVFPRHRDPATGQPLTALIVGDRYTTAGKWQTLRCHVADWQVRSRVRELRERFGNPRISSDGLYVNAAVVEFPTQPGTMHVGISDLRCGPIISPRPSVIRKVSATTSEDSPRLPHPAEFRLDRMRVRGYPFLPRITAYHGEKPVDLKQTGCNVIWIPRYNDQELVDELQRQGLWMTATPPGGPDERHKSPRLISTIDPFESATRSILFWMVGTRIPGSSKKELTNWVDRIRQADHRYDRPILGDVAGNEHVYSRYLSMLGVSRHILQTGFSFLQYRDWLIQKRKIARPGCFAWTWVQTEAAAGAGTYVVVEPEQIRLQVYAALSAGCRGIGYWKTTRLDGDRPGRAERRIAISLLNRELDLLAPWVSSGSVVGYNGFGVAESVKDTIGRRRIDFRSTPDEKFQRNALLNARLDREKRKRQQGAELRAAVIRSDYGTLLLPVWYETDAQFVPGQMAANNAKVTVNGVSDSASAWEITTTSVRSLVRERVAGGVQITLPKFDQTAAVIITSNRTLIEQLRRRVATIAPASGKLWVDLASRKFERVRTVDHVLEAMGHRQPDAPQLLHKALAMITEAKYALKQKDYDAARQASGNAMQLLRILQRAHWNDAVRRLTSPVGSPHAVCFQTLPEHWRMVRRLARSKPKSVYRLQSDQRRGFGSGPHRGPAEAGTPTAGNALPSGDFEDIETMIDAGWKHTQESHKAIRSVAELYPKAKQGSYSLRLVAAPIPGQEPPAYLSRPSVTVTSPPVAVRRGQIVQISGWARVATPIVGNLDGAVLYDTLGGYRRALRWKAGGDWGRFKLFREVREDGDFRVTMLLNGMGEIQFDDLQVRIFDHTGNMAKAAAPRDTAGNRSFLDRLPKLPLPSLPRFNIPRPTLPSWR